jgi:hypothetical protein
MGHVACPPCRRNPGRLAPCLRSRRVRRRCCSPACSSSPWPRWPERQQPSSGSTAPAAACRWSSATAAPAATGRSTPWPPIGWPSGWAPTSSSPTWSRPRTTSWWPGTKTRSRPPPTSPTIPSSPTAGPPRRSTARSSKAGSPRTSPWPSCAPFGPRSASPTCDPTTPPSTACTRCRPFRRSSTWPSGPTSASIRRPSTRPTSTRSACRSRSRCWPRSGPTATAVRRPRCSSSRSRSATSGAARQDPAAPGPAAQRHRRALRPGGRG